ncbi:RimJ/RimL family protein N-acetyltransferase [Streptacidiphilus sp. MAP12-33]|uniref:GNAT family N-acetyltransferase n=1 Tax=Streptacidiphilus sp. MAP12-33 TaxID=3156266 RepID=UPI00351492CB
MSADRSNGVRPAAVQLRPWRHDDVPALVAAHRDPSLRRWLRTHLEDARQAGAWVDREASDREAGVRLSFAVLVEEFAEPVGHVVLGRLAPSGDTAEVGYWTAPAARGRGVAAAALGAVLVEAAALERAVPLRRFDLRHRVGNDASCRVAQKAGFALARVLPADPSGSATEAHLHRLSRPGPDAAVPDSSRC